MAEFILSLVSVILTSALSVFMLFFTRKQAVIARYAAKQGYESTSNWRSNLMEVASTYYNSADIDKGIKSQITKLRACARFIGEEGDDQQLENNIIFLYNKIMEKDNKFIFDHLHELDKIAELIRVYARLFLKNNWKCNHVQKLKFKDNDKDLYSKYAKEVWEEYAGSRDYKSMKSLIEKK